MDPVTRLTEDGFDVARGFASLEDLAAFGLRLTERQLEQIARDVARDGGFIGPWARTFCSDRFGQATTHWRKLMDRLVRGVGNPCPLMLIGIPDRVLSP
jgi:hypothetical protein